MYKIISNFHSHTYRCGHADGKDEEYVLCAIKAGIKELGFSDHMPFKEGCFKPIRMDLDELDGYIESVKQLREKYKDQIKIHIGLECEYMDKYLDYYQELKKRGIEFMICGQHCFLDENNNNIWYGSIVKTRLPEYIDSLIRGMETGLFKFIAHPDLFMNGYQIWDEFAIKESRRLLEAANKYDIPLEINCNGIRYMKFKPASFKSFYPCEEFWKLVSQYGNKVVLGVDAHDPNEYLDEAQEDAINFAHNLGIKPMNVEKVDE